MLMNRCIQLGSDQDPLRSAELREMGPDRQTAGQFYFNLDFTVLIRIPKEAVVVISHGGEKRDYQAA